jgi:alanine racemase
MLYGASPMLGTRAEELGLKPVMTLSTALIAVHQRQRGDPVGYGGDFRCPEDMPVGVAAIGYGDGYPRHASSGTPVLVNGRAVPLIGRVSMDMITLDLRGQPDARVGDPVVLWGEGLPVDEVAQRAGTIAYELLCHVAERIPRVGGVEQGAANRRASRPG